MDCYNIHCRNQGYCFCREDKTSEAAAGCGSLGFTMVIGIFASFLYPAIRIFRSEIEYDENHSPKFAGSVWLFTSPLFGFLGNMLYQIVFAIGACAAEALHSKMTNSIYAAGMFLIYALAIGLALSAFLIKNRTVIKLFITEAATRTINKILILSGVGIMMLLTAFAGIGIVFAAADALFIFQSGTRSFSEKENKRISEELLKFDSYIGKYKVVTRNEKEVFIVSKSNDGKSLILNLDIGRNENDKTISGCRLSPKFKENSIYYTVSDCVVNGKISPLAKVYFESEKGERGKIKMYFSYNVRASGDTLEKIQ